MRLWVTRTQPQAQATAARLEALGHQAVVQPVLEVRPIAGAIMDLTAAGALAFTSRNGVAAFAALSDRRDLPVFVTGGGTARAAREAGFSSVESAAGDVRALAQLVAGRRLSGEVVWPGPEEPAGDLAGLLGQRGVRARRIAVYETVAAPGAAPEGLDGILIHSPKAARVLAQRLSDNGAPAPAPALFAISRAAAAPLEGFGFARVRVAAEPSEDALLALLR